MRPRARRLHHLGRMQMRMIRAQVDACRGGGATGEATYSDIAAALESEATKADLKCTEPGLVTGVRTALEGVDPTELKQQAQNTASSVTVQAS